MDFANLVIQIRLRAASTAGTDTSASVHSTLIALATTCNLGAGHPGETLVKVLAAMVGVNGDQDFDPACLDVLTPKILGQLDVVLDALMAGHIDRSTLAAAIRPALVRAVT